MKIDVETADLSETAGRFTGSVGFNATSYPSGLQTAVNHVWRGGQIVLLDQADETTMSYTPLVRSGINIECSYTLAYEATNGRYRR